MLCLTLATAVPINEVSASDAATRQIILDCSADSSDEPGLAGCVSTNLVQAETILLQTEQTWQKLIKAGIAPDTVLQDNAQSGENSSDQVGSQAAAEQTDKPKVIAIVNDTALESGVSIGGTQVLNVDDNAERGIDEPEVSFDTSIEISERFESIPALFRSYRDQHCAWQADLFGADRTQLYYQACLTSLTQIRTQELTLNLAAQRTKSKSGSSFRGYYVKTDSGAFFQDCERNTDWWVTGTETVLAALDRRFLDITVQSLADSDLLYAELRGNIIEQLADGPGTDYSAALSVRSFSLLRPVTEADCAHSGGSGPGSFASRNLELQNFDLAETVPAATVDDLAAAGFLYGYFNFWIAACSVTENTVCSAETDAEFASDGDWQLRVDRSLENDWRVLLIPTTENQVIEKQLTLQINGADVAPGKSYTQPLSLAIGRGALIADGESARELVAQLKLGRELRFQWFDDSDVMSELKFSLTGVTRALQYFDSAKS